MAYRFSRAFPRIERLFPGSATGLDPRPQLLGDQVSPVWDLQKPSLLEATMRSQFLTTVSAGATVNHDLEEVGAGRVQQIMMVAAEHDNAAAVTIRTSLEVTTSPLDPWGAWRTGTGIKTDEFAATAGFYQMGSIDLIPRGLFLRVSYITPPAGTVINTRIVWFDLPGELATLQLG